MPLARPVIPQPIAQGVLGMARITGKSIPSCFSMSCVETAATTETISFPGFISDLISSRISFTACGFTASRMISAPCTAARLSVEASMPNCLASERAFSAWRTVACTRFGCTSFCSRNARSKIPPIFPAPSTANLLLASLLESVVFMVPALLTRQSRPSTFFLCQYVPFSEFNTEDTEKSHREHGGLLGQKDEYSTGEARLISLWYSALLCVLSVVLFGMKHGEPEERVQRAPSILHS